MSQYGSDNEDSTVYKVVVNHEEQYSIWPEYKENPLGWRDAGRAGLKPECLAYIGEVWKDMRPLSLRKKMEEAAARAPIFPAPPSDKDTPPEKSLVDTLCDGNHRVEVSLRPERTTKALEQALNRDYLHIRFIDTRGGTELGVRLDRGACDFAKADLESGRGTLHVEGQLTLDYVKVRCIADIDVEKMEGKGHLVRVAEVGR